MTNRIALILGLIIVAALVTDMLIFGDAHILFLGKKLYELIEWMACWR